ncbi:unnamed protein product [Orchesella dallaii]|uniref:Uncharacterized protein n=1 Tax=Orchesella dallaii TaxID=48710 RepID=A0ABP1RYA0_9HEXA
MQWSTVVPYEYANGRSQRAFLNDGLFKIESEGGFKLSTMLSFIDLLLSLTLLTLILALSPHLLAPPPPTLLTYSGPKSFPLNQTNNGNETMYIPTNISSSTKPMEMKFHCERIGRQVVLADFLGQLIYSCGAVCVAFGALTKRPSFCYMHFPCSLIAITIGVGIRIIEVIYCRWFLMRWLWFLFQFVWYSVGDAVAKCLTIYMEEKELRMERTKNKTSATTM